MAQEAGDPTNQVLARTTNRLYAHNFSNGWDVQEALDFFCTSAQNFNQGMLLYGNTSTFSKRILTGIFHFVKSRADDTGEFGTISREFAGNFQHAELHYKIAILAVHRLILATLRHVELHPDLHNPINLNPQGWPLPPQGTNPCPAGNPFGIQCVCVAGSITGKYARGCGRGLSLLVVKDTELDTYTKRAALQFVNLPQGNICRVVSFLEDNQYQFHEHIAEMQGDYPRHTTRMLVNHRIVRHRVSIEGVMPGPNPDREIHYPQMYTDVIKVNPNMRVSFNDVPHPGDMGRTILIITERQLQSRSSLFKHLSQDARPTANDPNLPNRRRRITIPWAIPISMVSVTSEMTEPKATLTQWGNFFAIRQLNSSNDGRRNCYWHFSVGFLGLNLVPDTFKLVGLLARDPARRQYELNEVNLQFKFSRANAERREAAKARATDALFNFLLPFILARNVTSQFF